jgi:hypothetical protein
MQLRFPNQLAITFAPTWGKVGAFILRCKLSGSNFGGCIDVQSSAWKLNFVGGLQELPGSNVASEVQ